METRRLLLAVFVSMAAYFAYMAIWNQFRPPPPPPADPNAPRVAPQASAADPNGDANRPAALTTAPLDAPALSAPPVANEIAVDEAADAEPVVLGGGLDDALRLEFDPRGAAVRNLWLTARRGDAPAAPYVHRAAPDSDEPYHLLRAIDDGMTIHGSLVTRRLVLHQDDDRSIPLNNVVWQTRRDPAEPNIIAFETTLHAAGDPPTPLLRLTKRYVLGGAKPVVELGLTAENLSERPLRFSIDQDGPIGIPREQDQWDMRRLIAAVHDGAVVQIAEKPDRSALFSATEKGELLPLATTAGEEARFAWTGLTNRFFGLFLRPLPLTDAPPRFVRQALGAVAAPQIPKSHNPGDLLARLTLSPIKLAPGESATRRFELYAGAKDADKMRLVNPAYVDRAQLGYSLAQYADRACLCTFEPLPWIMVNLLHWIHAVFPNYGIAIIILVIIIRTLLHPLTVFQQKSMFRMQEDMARIQPKMQALKEKYANDKTKQNQEMMRLFSEEGVNPAGSMVSMIPMFVQMPILVALWVSLNADVELRHAPFMLWINDLSSPDELVSFGGGGLTIPLLGQLLPFMFANIPALNLLPVLMGVSMYVQQKYMPKPAQQARREVQQQRAAESGQVSQFEQQMKQQQMMAVMMSFMFPLMFYYMPAGLNLYWMATNVFGIGETLIIRRQMNAERERREREGPQVKKPKKAGPLSRIMRHMVEQAEELQRKADEVSDQPQGRRGKGRNGSDSKKGRS